MEHEVFVPVPAEALREALTDPARVARCVPGLQQDADAEAGPLSGRLRIRAGGHTITYQGVLRLAERDGVVAVEGKGSEVRGKGSVQLSLAIALTPLADGTTLTFTGDVKPEGRLADLPEEARESAAQRLIEKFVSVLATAAENARAAVTEAPEAPADAAADMPESGAVEGAEAGAEAGTDAGAERGAGAGTESGAGAGTGPGAAAGDVDRAEAGTDARAERGAGAGTESGAEAGTDADAGDVDRAVNGSADGIDDGDDDEADSDSDGVDDGVEEPHRPSVFETPVPPPSLDPFQGSDFEDAPAEYPAEPPAAEAAHARRTMIGRSAEEVDHAPPRGRYAPVPAAESTSAGATLRWIAPAAALAIASAVVVGRALRRRR